MSVWIERNNRKILLCDDEIEIQSYSGLGANCGSLCLNRKDKEVLIEFLKKSESMKGQSFFLTDGENPTKAYEITDGIDHNPMHPLHPAKKIKGKVIENKIWKEGK